MKTVIALIALFSAAAIAAPNTVLETRAKICTRPNTTPKCCFVNPDEENGLTCRMRK